LLALGGIGAAGVAATATGVAGLQIAGHWSEVAPQLKAIAAMLYDIDSNIESMAKKPGGAEVWAHEQLRQIARGSQLYPTQPLGPQPTFWH
jgi:hypothetical protein